jgi:glucokinase
MAIGIGVLVGRSVWVGAVEGAALGEVLVYPAAGESPVDLKSLRADEILAEIRRMAAAVRHGQEVSAVGAGLPGIVSDGVIQDSPNLGQLKGLPIAAQLSALLQADGIGAPVVVVNDADALAAGIAATRNLGDAPVRVWHLGDGIGFGHYPRDKSVWEAGHSVVSLDPRERFCGCGGIGHLEGICGYRAIRLRFLDMEPEEVFAAASSGDARAGDFVNLWHRALAAATATSIHLEGPGRFYLAGPNSSFVLTDLLSVYLHEMVKMSPLQGSLFEVIPNGRELALIGAALGR